jgi:hypothetical protein
MKHGDRLELEGFVQHPKALGAYYTDAQIADFLVNWAIRTPEDTILDPQDGSTPSVKLFGARSKEELSEQ